MQIDVEYKRKDGKTVTTPNAAEPGSIDMWLGPTTSPVTQPQVRSAQPQSS